ncbi:MAG: hypothetical protein ABW076_06680 [Candidatus Thiodiazotropha sp.]
MNHQVTDILIHTRQALSEQAFEQLSDQVYQDRGIVSIRRNIHRPKLLMVVYDAAVTGSMHILQQVRGQGHEATLVAM